MLLIKKVITKFDGNAKVLNRYTHILRNGSLLFYKKTLEFKLCIFAAFSFPVSAAAATRLKLTTLG